MVDFDKTSLEQFHAIGTSSFDFDSAVSGRSIVSGSTEEKSEHSASDKRRDWPYSFTEYLRGLIGKMIRVEYSYPSGQRMSIAGRLKTVGTDFISLRSAQTGEQVLIGFSAIASIRVSNSKK
ncbi:MAG: hypothetical protein KIG37_06845 [Oscillospiraceae bacterium]|nr:hypothetical protein [Oscillospiraceae bacterium]